MVRERVADDVYVFTSEDYAQVNAGAVIGPEWAVVIDTLAFPNETLEIREFIEGRLDRPVRYIINTHYHADHSLGNCWFPDAIVLSHAKCRQLLDTKGREALALAKQQNRDLAKVEIVLPDCTFQDGRMAIRVGRRTLQMLPFPGHSPDGMGVFLKEDRVLFSGDIMMPIPYMLDGDYSTMIESMKRIPKLKLENLVQGHGDVILRGEVQDTIKDNIQYINTVLCHAKKALRRREPAAFLAELDVESAGKSRILLNGLAEHLHQRNLEDAYQRLKNEVAAS